ncbi:hypothetical protein [Halorubrum halodurans]|uniref:Uncharacterized protein n=1 Tax=Halorubrum halodurans TaxID=1383851 RepID=A0A256IJB9_9EURY|nr:hypothetical protein [Halorubrum halodurans]OYR56668.1 hypothetical protein DJ70_08100 [Halorubrum halodurans]
MTRNTSRSTTDAVTIETTTTTSDILSKPDAINDLTDNELIDVYVRMKLTQELSRHTSASFRRSTHWDELLDALKTGENYSLKEIAIQTAGRDADITQSLGWERGPGNTRTLYERYTDVTFDDMIEETDAFRETLETAREAVQAACRGCGTDAITVCRARIEHHADK